MDAALNKYTLLVYYRHETIEILSFLHLALECVVKKEVEKSDKGTKKEREVKK